MRDIRSVAAAAARWRVAFVAVFVTGLALKLAVAASLAPFVDEAFYWQESRHLAWGYSDLPPLTAWLIHLGESVAGHGLLGMRWPFIVIGSALPWLVVALARRYFGAKAGWQAGLCCLALPLAGTLGVLALPDVPLTVAIALAIYALARAMDENRLRDWLLLGMALALAWMTHYRAAMPMLAGLLLMALTPRGRMQWRRGGFWLAMGMAALGLIPLIVSNLHQQGAGLEFQLVQRNPWSFHAGALVQPLEQAVACTPILYALLLWALWQCLRRCRDGAPWDWLAVTSATFLIGYFLFGLFADNTHFRAHWPLPGYLPLLAALPVLLTGQRVRRIGWKVWVVAAFALAAAGQLAAYVYLGVTASGGRALIALHETKAFPTNFTGWRQSANVVRRLLADMPANTVLVADNFILGAELEFQLDSMRPVYVLDSPLNVKHGRAAQLAVWQRDEKGLYQSRAGAPALLVVDEWILRAHQRPKWLGSVCSRMADPQFLERLDLYDGERRFAFYAARVPAHALPARPRDACVVWRKAYAAEQRFLGQDKPSK
ncbi:MAG TPA: glycosyltransferase family 39 protein [Rhodanobacteraceae bacterium]|nr:glycosyltransferase family 39 protein [Rhodanobacteraceae bacterium]